MVGARIESCGSHKNQERRLNLLGVAVCFWIKPHLLLLSFVGMFIILDSA